MNEETKKQKFIKKPIVQSIIGMLSIFLILGGYIYWQVNHNTIFIENAMVEAPIINLSPSTAGTLSTLYVKEGDKIKTDTPIALIGTDIVTSKQDGIIVSTKNNIGEFFTPGEPVVSMVHPDDMRIVGTIDENKGLSDIKVGEKAMFTVDTFGSKTYLGIVDNISSTSNDTGVLFSISDKRPIKKFDIKIKFNIADYPELKNGMSAKITVYTK